MNMNKIFKVEAETQTQTQDQVSNLIPSTEAPRPSTSPPPRFVAYRGGTFEPVFAQTVEEAVQTLRKQIHASKLPCMYLYSLQSGVFYEPSSVVIPADDIAERLNNSSVGM